MGKDTLQLGESVSKSWSRYLVIEKQFAMMTFLEFICIIISQNGKNDCTVGLLCIEGYIIVRLNLEMYCQSTDVFCIPVIFT